MTSRRQDTGAAVAGLFANVTATGGLAGRETRATRGADLPGPDAELSGRADAAREAELPSLAATGIDPLGRTTRVRVGVELSEEQCGYLRALSRPGRTNEPRTLGTKFVATGVLVAAIELLRTVEVDMHGVSAGDDVEMAARARAALLRAGREIEEGGNA